jgi:hypothetical protein
MSWAALKLFLATPLGRALAGIVGGLAVIAALIAGLLLLRAVWIGEGVAQEKAAESSRLEAATKAVAKVNTGGAKITSDVATKLAEKRTEIRWRTRVQLQEVIRYVPVESDRACIVGLGAWRVHQHAFAGLPGLPDLAGRPVETPSGVPLSDLVADDVDFAGTAYDWRAEALAWREWYPRWAALWKANIRTPPVEPPSP